ncbi:MAG: insulinase family protein, partial [Clostridia bacterium]|nr:insulinase family protein [Clostridia bacterium]
MDFVKGLEFYGFTVDRVRDDKKAGGKFIEMTHIKTGARLCYSKNAEENKLFSIAFKTIPVDSTGVFHILEHSVLCGSEKFPVKEPFVELLKGSMNTFLNALTYPDKTVYPVSSRNDKDFLNLATVYLDAVFAPALLSNKNIFLQEGRRLECVDGVPSFNGVVLNEMRGAMSEADDRLEEDLGALLFPDNCYGFNSGGDPSEIPSLTYEKFVETYRAFYHPSNSYIYLDGDINEDETFALIDSYLSKYDKVSVSTDINYQTPTANERYDCFACDDASSKRDIYARAKIFAKFDEPVKIFAANVLCDYLASTNESPLKRAILASGLAEDLEVTVSDGIMQPYASIAARNISDADAGKIENVISETLEKIIKDGIPEEDLVACINKFEFSFRQMPEPKGLYRNIIALDSWLYGGDPMLYLDVDGCFASLRKMIGDGSYEKLLSAVFADKEGSVTLHLLASETFAAETAASEAECAKKAYDAMNDEAASRHAEELDVFKVWQDTPDSEECTATIPTLPLSEVSDVPPVFPTEEFEENGVKLLYHKIASNGIVYFSIYAPLTQFTLEELSYISVLPALFKQLPTEKHDAVTLQREIKTYLGSFYVNCQAFADYGQTEHCKPCIVANASALEENFERAKELVAEVLTSTVFEGNRDRIHEIVKQIDEANRQKIVASGHTAAIVAARSTLSSEGAATEALGGVTMDSAVKRVNSSFDEKVSALCALFRRVVGESFTKENIVMSQTSETMHDMSSLISAFKSGAILPEHASYKSALNDRISVKTPSQVAFAVKADSLKRCGVEYSGAFKVAANILSLSYLWNMVRVRAGAYGTGLYVTPGGTVFCYSYRDPAPASSLDAYDGCADFIEQFANSGEALDKYIISTVSSEDPLRTPSAKGSMADALYFSKTAYEYRERALREMIAAGKDDFLRFAAALRHMAKDGKIAVVGGEMIDACEGLT